MRVLYISPSGGLGGAERVLLDIVASARARPGTQDLHVILLEDGPLKARLLEQGASVRVLQLPAPLRKLGEASVRAPGGKIGKRVRLLGTLLPHGPAILWFVRGLRSAIREIHPDVIHTNGFKAHVLGALAARRGDIVAWHMHDFLRERAGTRILRAFQSRAAIAVAISNAVAEDVRESLPRLRTHAILNGVDLAHFHPAPGDAKALGDVPDSDVLRVGLVATYSRWKGQETFIDALARLKSQPGLPRFRAYIVGGAVYSTTGSQFERAELEALVAGAGIGSIVSFVDFKEDVAPIYRALDIVVHASTSPEPFGRTIAEAMACGRAVIVSRGGGAKELFTENVDALGFEPGNADELSARIALLLSDGTLRRRLAQNAADTAKARFDRVRQANELESLYDSLVKPRRGR